MKYKQELQCVGIFLLGMLILSGLFFLEHPIKKDQCSEFGVIYLNENQESMASKIADDINGIVVIPATNKVYGRTDYLKCNNFNMWDYIQ